MSSVKEAVSKDEWSNIASPKCKGVFVIRIYILFFSISSKFYGNSSTIIYGHKSKLTSFPSSMEIPLILPSEPLGILRSKSYWFTSPT
jgi:hypothetical protein